jgi:hypothetical protein
MPTPRQSCRAVAAAALAALFVLSLSHAPGQPDKKDKKDKKDRFDYFVQIDKDFNDDDTVSCPYDLKVDYGTDADGYEVVVTVAGTEFKKDAPKDQTQVTISIEFPKDTTGANMLAELRPKKDLGDVKDTDHRYRLDFICGGMGFREAFTFDLPKGAKRAEKAKNAGEPISVGWHGDPFKIRGYDEEPKGFQARMLIQGRYPPPTPSAPRPPLNTEYDLPVEVRWTVQAGKWYPHWVGYLEAPLWAQKPMIPPDGGKPIKPETVVRVMLLNPKGKVLHTVPYRYY